MHIMNNVSAWNIAIAIVCYFVTRSIYRLYLHPLHKFPGPKLAAITDLYEFYYSVLRKGTYLWEVERMHQKYGPIVRVNPRELHIIDPSFYEQIYASSSRKREKDPNFVPSFTLDKSVVATVPHELHRFRRGLLNNFFSKQSIQTITPEIQKLISQLLRRFQCALSEGEVVRLDDAFSALTTDIITYYSYGKSWGYLEHATYNREIREAISELADAVHINRYFPWVPKLFRCLPSQVMRWISPGITGVFDRISSIVSKSDVPDTGNTDSNKLAKTIFDALKDPAIPACERTMTRLQDEGFLVLAAGTETTANALTVAAFHLYSNKQILFKLREEIREVMPDLDSPAPWLQLEQLPYMTAVVQETLRISLGVIFRSPRVAPDETLVYKNHVIPPGTPVSMSTYFVQMDPTLFPDPKRFRPERWIEANDAGARLSKYIVAFSKGSRACLGINLAYAELYMTLAAIVRRFDLEIYDTPPENLSVDRELAIPVSNACGHWSVKAKVVGTSKDHGRD